MLRLATAFVLGYHGCDRDVGESILSGAAFRHSKNPYDWLGEGIYFWEANPFRGLDWAVQAKTRPNGKVKNPIVIGAVIDLGACLDLTTANAIEMLRIAHSNLTEKYRVAGEKMPRNQDELRRQLDCAIIDHAYLIYSSMGMSIDSVRGVFVEGEPVFAGSHIYERTHIQIAVRNPKCIKGVFRVPDDHLFT